MLNYLFRGKSADGGAWVYGSLLERPGRRTIVPAEGPAAHIPVNPASIGIHTGLFDSRGVRVFEGDILEGKGGRVVVVRDPDTPSVTAMSVKEWALRRGVCYAPAWLQANSREMSVVGNRYDTPEMLDTPGEAKK